MKIAAPRVRQIQEKRNPRMRNLEAGMSSMVFDVWVVWTLSGIGVETDEVVVVRGGLNMLRTSLASCRVVEVTSHIGQFQVCRNQGTIIPCSGAVVERPFGTQTIQMNKTTGAKVARSVVMPVNSTLPVNSALPTPNSNPTRMISPFTEEDVFMLISASSPGGAPGYA